VYSAFAKGFKNGIGHINLQGLLEIGTSRVRVFSGSRKIKLE
jgi:hypothetical protein